MPFRRASCQKSKSLRAFYEEVAADSHVVVGEAGRLMTELVDDLEQAFRDIPVWGLTSHFHLMLLAADDSATPWFVSVTPPVGGSFTIDYLLPEFEAPWPNARVTGEAKSVKAAVEMVLLAIEKSRGWEKK